ncbi:hypothetical protein BKA24_000524 [Microbacterium marinum]|uniref:DUF4913 domain-containing protein n=1 Tax=Microbacterium marinum TaxID=421115 RepID=A0A7W7BNC7_9MICO|nr:DUF4913 domain-containing protein [Microbacterium marinum]MBB4665815.1 hypothetical protein [Microbacterium marinum]HCJ47840.1 DUF4913 domain-containing protein [Microbacterium sp.]
MSDLLDDFRDDGDDVDEPTPELVYGSVDEFVREYLRHMYTRPVGPGNARYRWAADWWRYPEAVARLEGLWRSWEHLRLDPATGASVWWRDHADPHMHLLLSPDGPFAKSKDACEPGEPLPYTEPPKMWFPDVRLMGD